MEIPGPNTHESAFAQILRFHEYIFADNQQEWCERAVNFMIYDLTSRHATEPDLRATDVLDDFFFKTKKFQISNIVLPPRTALAEKRGSGLFVAILYCHLAQALKIKAQILNWPQHHYVRRTCSERTVYVDLDQNGKVLSEDEVLNLLSRSQRDHNMLSLREMCICHLRTLVSTLMQFDNPVALHRTLNILLNAEPENTKWLAERALLRRKMGLLKEALQDIKRYFAFVERHSAAKEIVEIYEELQSHATV